MEANRRKSKRKVRCLWGEATRPRIGGGLSSGSSLLAEMNGSEGGWVLFPGRAGGEGHKIRLPSR